MASRVEKILNAVQTLTADWKVVAPEKYKDDGFDFHLETPEVIEKYEEVFDAAILGGHCWGEDVTELTTDLSNKINGEYSYFSANEEFDGSAVSFFDGYDQAYDSASTSGLHICISMLMTVLNHVHSKDECVISFFGLKDNKLTVYEAVVSAEKYSFNKIR